MLRHSDVVVTVWKHQQLIGFGRASSDGVFRAVLWDIVVARPQQGRGLGQAIVNTLLTSPKLRDVEKVYLMTTNSAGFYCRMGFASTHRQHLLVRRQKSSANPNN